MKLRLNQACRVTGCLSFDEDDGCKIRQEGDWVAVFLTGAGIPILGDRLVTEIWYPVSAVAALYVTVSPTIVVPAPVETPKPAKKKPAK
jgi:hypothetical protein